MSDFIDEKILQTPIITNYQQLHYSDNVSVTKKPERFNRDQIFKNLLKVIPNLTAEYFLQNLTNENQNIINLRLSFSNCGLLSLNVLIGIKIDLSKKSFQPFISILDGEKPFKIQSLNKRILICKLFCKSTTKNQNKIAVSLVTGAFKVLKPINYFWQSDFNEYLLGKIKEKNFVYYITKTIQESIQIFKPVLRQLIEGFDQDTNEKRRSSQQAIQMSIYRYILKSTIAPSFDVSFGSGKYEMMECLSLEQNFYTNSMAQNIVTDFNQFNSHNLYLTPKVPLKNLRRLYAREYFNSNQQQLTALKTKIEPPGTRLNMGLQSKYIYNMIELNENSKIQLRRINNGGFSEICIGEVQFWYMLSASNKRVVKLEELKRQNQSVGFQSKVKKQHKKNLGFQDKQTTKQ